MKPPRELWVVVRDGVVIHYASRRESEAVLMAHTTLDAVVRYVLPAKPKPRKRKEVR